MRVLDLVWLVGFEFVVGLLLCLGSFLHFVLLLIGVAMCLVLLLIYMFWIFGLFLCFGLR